ncbi:MAG: hypothetical protein AWU59_921 [Methanolobus sp. T82-4]|jgi:hypothetical protein|nr:MAG: hypothetical protein AWU59_921 [Methanolobus sp. T82-4]
MKAAAHDPNAIKLTDKTRLTNHREIWMSIQHCTQQIRVDIPRDFSLLIILIGPMIVMYFFLIMGIFSKAFEILAYILWYLIIAALILQDHTKLEMTNGKIIIHRRFSDPVTLDVQNIKDAKTKKVSFLLRSIVYLCIIGVVGYYSYDTLQSIQRYQVINAPLEATIHLAVSKITLIVFFYVALLSRAERRVKHSTYVEVKTNNGTFAFYSDKPEEFEKAITKQVHSISQVNS